MDTPNDEHVDIKVEGPGAGYDLPFLTSDEVRAGTYLGHPNAPAESYYAYPLHTLPQVSQHQPFAPTNVPSPFPQPFAPTNVPIPFHQSFAPPNVPTPSPTPFPTQAQTQPEVSQTGQKLFAPTNNFGSLPDAYTYKYPQPGWGGQPYSQPVHVGQFSPTSPLHSTAQSLQSQIPRGLQGYVLPQPGESQPRSFQGAFNGPPSSFQDTSLPQKRPFPASAGHSFNATRATTTRNTDNATNGDFFSQTRDPFPQTRAYLASTRCYNFNVNTPNNTNFVMGNHALASQNQAPPTNVAVRKRQYLMDTQLMPPPKSTQPLRNLLPNTQPTQGPRTQQWRTDNLQRK
jgi:hypothetical protein